MDQIWLFVIFIGLAVPMVGFGIVNARRRMAEWTAFAQDKGLTVQGRWPDISMHGALDGSPFSLRQWRTGSGKHVHHHLHVSVPLSGHFGDLSVTPEGLMAKLGKVFGGQDIQIGDSTFDGAFIVKCSQPEQAANLLPPPARDALHSASRNMPGSGEVGLYEGALHFRREGWTTPTELQEVTSRLSNVARSFER